MRNFLFVFISLSFFAFAGEKEDLQKSIVQEQKRVALGEIREFHEAYVPLWPGLKAELEAVAALSLDTTEQIQDAQRRLAAVKLSVTKLEIRKVLEVVSAAYEKSQASAAEKGAARSRIDALKAALEKAASGFEVMRVKLQLIGVAKKAHISVGQASVAFYIFALKKGNEQLMAWWEQNEKSTTGREELRMIQHTLGWLEPRAASGDKRQLEQLHMELTLLDIKVLGIFTREP